jgi:hypothetical protein
MTFLLIQPQHTRLGIRHDKLKAKPEGSKKPPELEALALDDARRVVAEYLPECRIVREIIDRVERWMIESVEEFGAELILNRSEILMFLTPAISQVLRPGAITTPQPNCRSGRRHP